MLGSAVLVAPGIAIGATHVLQEHIERLKTGQHAASCFGTGARGISIWNLYRGHNVPRTDLTVLNLEYASAIESGDSLHICSVSTRLPKIGEELAICGFRADEKSFLRGKKSRLTANVIVTKGKVTARYPNGRDSVMLPWPCLEVSCPSWGGMSGGPAFDSAGRLVGILSSSFEAIESPEPSYVSLVWPALTPTLQEGWPRNLIAKPTNLIDYPANLCDIDKRTAVFKILDKEGNVSFGYQPWE
jgi:hypothetical protein